MALEESHEKLFRAECINMILLVLESLQKLVKNPVDQDALEKLVNSADVIIGGAKFLEDKELEASATMIVTSFKGVKDVREKPGEFKIALNHFMVNAKW